MLSLALAPGCGGEDDAMTTAEEEDYVPACGEETTRVLTNLDAPFGWSSHTPAELIALVERPRFGTLTWSLSGSGYTVTHAGTTSEVVITGALDGDVVLLEVARHGGTPDGSLGGTCSNSLLFDVDLTFETSDGVLQESIEARFKVSALQ
ncbi:MAG: hypothetical protein KC468_31185 [Myxococcales bacterium]|nr:hypothetical protein [Myxococcales bacterium]